MASEGREKGDGADVTHLVHHGVATLSTYALRRGRGGRQVRGEQGEGAQGRPTAACSTRRGPLAKSRQVGWVGWRWRIWWVCRGGAAVSGGGSLLVSCWLLAAGCWLLAAGYKQPPSRENALNVKRAKGQKAKGDGSARTTAGPQCDVDVQGSLQHTEARQDICATAPQRHSHSHSQGGVAIQ